MARFRQGDYVKAEFWDKPTRESKRVWFEPESCDDEVGILFRKLDSAPLLGTDLHSGDELAASCDKVVEQGKASDFEEQ